MSTSSIQIDEVLVIGENDGGYQFAVGRIADRWIGFARDNAFSRRARAAFRAEGFAPEPAGLFVFHEVGEDCQMGLTDKGRAIRLTGAVACDPESSYGGIDRWYVPEELRGRPDDFRCEHCERVGCDGRECREGFSDEI